MVLPGPARQQLREDVRQFGAQHRADRGQERVGLVGLRDAGPRPVEEVVMRIVPRLARVLLEHRDPMAPPPQHERCRQPADTPTDHRNPRHQFPFAPCCVRSL
ncbi:hypothetical protein P405_20725 [Streptomyces sp. FR-008]|nr:hypothetical protein P405_20725 [Streptomyces sp. FR-008]